jgi:hypothetical protein
LVVTRGAVRHTSMAFSRSSLGERPTPAITKTAPSVLAINRLPKPLRPAIGEPKTDLLAARLGALGEFKMTAHAFFSTLAPLLLLLVGPLAGVILWTVWKG